MSHGYGEARPIGRMVPRTQALEPPPPATCARCACKLSRYRDTWEQHCSTCRRVLVAEGALVVPAFEPTDTSAARAQKATLLPPPLTEQEKAAQPRLYVMCACGRGRHKRRSMMCAECALDKRRGKRPYRNLSTEDRILTGKYDVCADCKKELKLKRAQRCGKCAALARRTAGPGSRFCECGQTKGTSNEKCMTCRYPNSARAQLRRLNRAA